MDDILYIECYETCIEVGAEEESCKDMCAEAAQVEGI